MLDTSRPLQLIKELDVGKVIKKVTGSLFGSDIPDKAAKPIKKAEVLQGKQTAQIDDPTKREKLRLAEEGSALAKKKAFIGSKSSGRQSLIATSQTGLKSTLGGS